MQQTLSNPTQQSERVVELALDQLHPDADQPRQNFDDQPEDNRGTKGDFDQLVSSIRELGVLEPLIVFRDASDKLTILAGHRRYRAAKAAGRTSVPCVERTIGSRARKIAMQIAENLHRADLTLFDTAHAYANLVAAELAENPGKDKAVIAEENGLTRKQLSDYLFLATKVHSLTQQALAANLLLSTSTARMFDQIADNDLKANLIDDARRNHTTIGKQTIQRLLDQEAEKRAAEDPSAMKTATRQPKPAPPSESERRSLSAAESESTFEPPPPSTLSPSSGYPRSGEDVPPPPNDDPPPEKTAAMPTLPLNLYTIELTREEIEALFALLGAEPPPAIPEEAAIELKTILSALG